jgi:hypothetical protein
VVVSLIAGVAVFRLMNELVQLLAAFRRGKHGLGAAAVGAATGGAALFLTRGIAAMPAALNATQHSLYHRAVYTLSFVAVAGICRCGGDSESDEESKRFHRSLSINDVKAL